MTQTVLVVNAVKADAVRAEELRHKVAEAFEAVGLPAPRLAFTSEHDPGREAARAAVLAGARLVVACGGDGTVNAVAEALAGTGVTLGIVPLGTGNLLAANLGVPTSLDEAVRVLATGTDRTIDLGRAGGRVFAGMAGLGLDAAMVADAPAGLKKRIGWPAYLVSIARHLPDRGVTVTLRLDGRPVRLRGVRMLLIGNIGRVQGNVELFPDAAPDDGVLDVVALAPRGPLIGWLAVAVRLITRREGSDDRISRLRARHVVAHTSRPVARELDGEPYGRGRVLDVRVQPGALRVRVASPAPRRRADPTGPTEERETSSR
jgi:diacylglycerol kinase (ATP)